MVTVDQLERRVRVEALHVVHIARSRDIGAAIIERAVARVRGMRRRSQLWVIEQPRLGCSDAARGLEPIDLAHEVGAGEVAGRRKRASGIIGWELVSDRRRSVNAARANRSQRPRMPTDLCRDDRTIGSIGVRDAYGTGTLSGALMGFAHAAHHTSTPSSPSAPNPPAVHVLTH
jgi:hypothetical protein